MKRGHCSLSAILISGLLIMSCSQKDESKFHQLNGPYLGQTPPGMTPELFAPGILSDGLFNGLIYFPAGGTEVYFSSGFERPFYISMLFHSRMKDGGWTEPVEFPVERSVFHRPVLNPDGTKVFFISSQAEETPDGESSLTKIYYIERVKHSWTAPKSIDFGDAFPYGCSQTSVAANGNIYFQAGYDIDGDEDIYVSRYEDGNYRTPVRLSDAINGPDHDVHPFIAPDESYLIFDAERAGGFGENDLYVSFRNGDGEWSQTKNMGPNVNSARDERRSSVSFDGKYLFFESHLLDRASQLPEQPLTLNGFQEYATSFRNGSANFYWVDAKVIEDLKPRVN